MEWHYGLNIRFFNKENQTDIFKDVLKKILQLGQSSDTEYSNDITKYDYLLTRDAYYVDYGILFKNYDLKSTLKGADYLHGLLSEWLSECKSLKYFDEHLIYVFERIAFLPVFGKQNALSNWYDQIEKAVGDFSEKDIGYYKSSSLLKHAKTVFTAVNSYTRFKMTEDFTPTQNDYEELAMSLKFNPPPKNIQVNPLIEVLYYDYYGLINMKLFDYTQSTDYLFAAKECYEKILDEYLDRVDLVLSVWGGFLSYNIARLYEKLYNLDKNSVNENQIVEAFLRAVTIRKKWLSADGFNGMIQSALSYEYFIAKIDYVKQLKNFNIKSREYIQGEYQKIEGEIESYCNSDERLERLLFVRNQLKKIQSE